MRLIEIAGLAAALALTASPALAAKTVAKDEAVAEQGASTAASGERKICKRLQMTGTRMKNDRVCLTKAEWKEVDAMK